MKHRFKKVIAIVKSQLENGDRYRNLIFSLRGVWNLLSEFNRIIEIHKTRKNCQSYHVFKIHDNCIVPCFNPFVPNAPFLFSLKTSEKVAREGKGKVEREVVRDGFVVLLYQVRNITQNILFLFIFL